MQVDVQCAQNCFLADIDVWHQVECLHVDAYADPVHNFRCLHVLIAELLLRASDFFKVQLEVSLQFFHVELEVTNFTQVVHLLYEKHGVVLVACH